MATTGDPSLHAPGRDARVIGLIGAGHFFSHYYLLCLPPLFPLLKGEFGVSYAALGFMMTCFNLIGGIIQAPMGFLVDRFGARWILLAGLGLMAASVGLMGVVGSYEGILILAVLAGIGNSVIHPADYAILSGAVDSRRMGRAFSVHTFAGEFGGSFAPLVIVGLAALWDWRLALVLSGIAGLVVAVVMASQSALLVDDTAAGRAVPAGGAPAAEATPRRFLTSPAMLLFFAFFMTITLSAGGLNNFAIPGLMQGQGLAQKDATIVLSVFLFASSFGVLLGGVVADRVRRQEATMAVALFLGAGLLLLPALVALPLSVLVAIFLMVGIAQGVTRPARDMMVRAATPAGASGKAFGFVSVGLSIGSSIAPVLFGWVMDQGRPEWVFLGAAGFMMAMLATAVAGHYAPAPTRPRR